MLVFMIVGAITALPWKNLTWLMTQQSSMAFCIVIFIITLLHPTYSVFKSVPSMKKRKRRRILFYKHNHDTIIFIQIPEIILICIAMYHKRDKKNVIPP